jgi:hypothetical protein
MFCDLAINIYVIVIPKATLAIVLLRIIKKRKGCYNCPCTNLTLPYLCACLKPGPEFPPSYVMVFLIFNDLKSEVIVCFVDVGKIVDHHCLKFLLIISITSFPYKIYTILVHVVGFPSTMTIRPYHH